ncbi:Acyl-CoA synthetase (AMP-forming)/AMP-acid ligase II [Actinopolyspora alba]|uniref:Acyl-CoA synthetase (AMP-forming)/AMP-acid ligase II n=1 Tax=Actinopolyspora alba TaxID=673379 RepID=A0A1I2C143_9ACTN|nr:AMP-binding protein [Actinopolyspora alba]SFE62166.1 Acyl-CoA synthetase (AMP-forming)/AMP-acid ligase II [Actinopolyspora alba]
MTGSAVHPLEWLERPRADTSVEFFDAESAGRTSYTDIAARALGTAGGLVECGVAAGSVVPLLCRTGPDLIAGFYGVQAAGCAVSVLAPPTRMSGDENRERVRRVLDALEADVLVVDAHHEHYARQVVTDPDFAARRTVRLLVLEELAMADPVRRDAAELAIVQFTSGSSGRPRAVLISHDALAANVAAIRAWEGATERDAWCSWLPMHHDMGLIGCMVVPVSGGTNGLSVCTPESFLRHPLAYLRRFDRGGATITATPTFGLRRVVERVRPDDLDGLDLSHWRAVIVGAERIDPTLARSFTELLADHGLDARALTPAYGLAESTLAVTGVSVRENPASVRVRRGELAVGAPVRTDVSDLDEDGIVDVISCGRPLAGTDVLLVDANGEPVPEGHLGELVVTGDSLADGYLDDAPEGARAADTAFRNGRLHTRDVAFERDGEVYVLGRLGDGIKVNARFLLAEDVEMALGRAGLDLNRVCVVLGEVASRAHAYAVLEELDADCAAIADRVLGSTCPGATRHVERVPRGTIPRTTSGKYRRRELWLTLSHSSRVERPT